MTTRPVAPTASTAARVLLSPSLSGACVCRIEYIGNALAAERGDFLGQRVLGALARLRIAGSSRPRPPWRRAPAWAWRPDPGRWFRRCSSAAWAGPRRRSLRRPASVAAHARRSEVLQGSAAVDMPHAREYRRAPAEAVCRTFVLEEGADVELVHVGAQLVQRLGARCRRIIRQRCRSCRGCSARRGSRRS